jgi:hypothetical protein
MTNAEKIKDVLDMSQDEIYDCFVRTNNTEVKTFCYIIAEYKNKKIMGDLDAVVYSLIFPDGKRYIGVTGNLNKRIFEHRYEVFLTEGDDWKMGEFTRTGNKLNMHKLNFKNEPIDYEILERIDENSSEDIENKWIEKFDSLKNGLNGRPGSKLSARIKRKGEPKDKKYRRSRHAYYFS